MSNGQAIQPAKAVKRELNDLIVGAREKIAGRLPSGMDTDRFIFSLMTAIQKNPDLLLCDPQSVLLAAYDAAELGINLSPTLALGWLIPYKQQCSFQVSYRGLMQKAHETKAVKSFFAEVVYQCDRLERQFAPKRNLFHAPGEEEQRIRDNAIGAYAFIEYTDGVQDWEYLTAEQIERRRRHSKAPNSMMWTTFWEEGYRKTPVRVLWKRIPLTNTRMEALAEAVERDTERELEAEPTGKLELDLDNHVPQAAAEPDKQPTKPPAAANLGESKHVEMVHALFCVGATETMLSGDVRPLLDELPHLGAKLNRKTNTWALPVARTSDLVELMESRKMIFREVDEQGHFLDAEPTAEEQSEIWPRRR